MTAMAATERAAAAEERAEPLLKGAATSSGTATAQLWQGNFSGWWLLASCVCVWFCFIYGPPRLSFDQKEQHIGPFLILHLLGSVSLVPLCIWNVFHTPSHGEVYKRVHKVVGKLAIGASTLGTGGGFVTTFWERAAVVDVSQKVFLGFVGVLQLWYTARGVWEIRAAKTAEGKRREELIERHAASMVGVFCCCFGASMVRVLAKLLDDASDPAAQVAGLVLMFASVNGAMAGMRRAVVKKQCCPPFF